MHNRYWCEIEDREVSYGEIGQGYEMAGGRIIPLTDEELRQLPLPTARAIELVGFLPTEEISTMTAPDSLPLHALAAARRIRIVGDACIAAGFSHAGAERFML
ncbi:Ku protein [Streptomyces sp. NPDC057611]|uniref:Ku protein n=1 Tax=Streptomyces sp. NPDC057611 TaxID=3346182 RepID=UPI0036C16B14